LAKTQKGQAGKSGLSMSACFRVDESKQLVLDVSVSNNSGQTVNDFDIMFNKNPFGIAIYNAVGALKFPS
jgi:hypothetical protein